MDGWMDGAIVGKTLKLPESKLFEYKPIKAGRKPIKIS